MIRGTEETRQHETRGKESPTSPLFFLRSNTNPIGNNNGKKFQSAVTFGEELCIIRAEEKRKLQHGRGVREMRRKLNEVEVRWICAAVVVAGWVLLFTVVGV